MSLIVTLVVSAFSDDYVVFNAVKSNELKWLPNGSELLLESKPDSNPELKPRTYTSFSCSQDSLPEFSNNPISPMLDITIARLGPGQVKVSLCFGCYSFRSGTICF